MPLSEAGTVVDMDSSPGPHAVPTDARTAWFHGTGDAEFLPPGTQVVPAPDPNRSERPAALMDPRTTAVSLQVVNHPCAYREPHGWHWQITQATRVERAYIVRCPGVALDGVDQIQDWMPGDPVITDIQTSPSVNDR